MTSTKINFSLPDITYKSLNQYAERTGRSKGDVVRQLVIELLEGDRAIECTTDSWDYSRRSSALLPIHVSRTLDEFAEKQGWSKSQIVSALLHDFLIAGPTYVSESEFVDITISKDAFDDLQRLSDTFGTATIEETLQHLIHEREAIQCQTAQS